MNRVALDIGGANLKAAHSNATCVSRPFALYRQPDALADELESLLAALPAFDALLVTMTAELCDCFTTKRQGVAHVLDAVVQVARGKPVHVWLTSGMFVEPARAAEQPLATAASNWHALATCIAMETPHATSLMIDVGSTTTDIVLLREGKPVDQGLTDLDRLASGALVYIGAARTALMALGPTVHVQPPIDRLPCDVPIAVMAEYFATTADVFVLTGATPEQPDNRDTADGQPLMREACAARMARMVGGDTDMLTPRDIAALAKAFGRIAVERIAHAARRIAGTASIAGITISGSGARLARAAAREAFPDTPVTSLSDAWGEAASSAACAAALLKLAESHAHAAP